MTGIAFHAYESKDVMQWGFGAKWFKWYNYIYYKIKTWKLPRILQRTRIMKGVSTIFKFLLMTMLSNIILA